jgi:hypothetical protein
MKNQARCKWKSEKSERNLKRCEEKSGFDRSTKEWKIFDEKICVKKDKRERGRKNS